jgi:hypothetical protein
MADTLTGKTQFLNNKEPNISLSRYNKIRLLLNDESIPIQETWDKPNIQLDATDAYFEVTEEYAYRPDLISLKYYGTEQLYWIIGIANNMEDAFAQTYVGAKLRIPNRDYVFNSLLAK